MKKNKEVLTINVDGKNYLQVEECLNCHSKDLAYDELFLQDAVVHQRYVCKKCLFYGVLTYELELISNMSDKNEN